MDPLLIRPGTVCVKEALILQVEIHTQENDSSPTHHIWKEKTFAALSLYKRLNLLGIG